MSDNYNTTSSLERITSLSELIDSADQPPKDENTAIIEKAILDCVEDVGAPFEPDVIEALSTVKKNDPAQYLRYRKALKKANREITLGMLDSLVKQSTGDISNDAESTADLLTSITTENAELFTDENKEPFASFEQDGHKEVWPINSKGFREWLSYKYYAEFGKAPRDASMKDSLNTLAGIATHEGDERAVYLRCAPNPDGGSYYIDLCNEKWQVVEVTSTGWRVVDESPVKFKRTNTMHPLPMPGQGGKLVDLWKFANVSKENRGLVIAWLLEAFRPETPFPILELGGEQGSAKSSTQSRLRDFIDPSGVNLRAAPKTVEDVFVSAARNHLASYNNLSHLSAPIQDALCTLATGGGYGGRKLFTNDEESVWESKRPVVMNGISALVTAPDLLDRTIRTESPKLETYISESELQKDFDEKHAGIFGALLDLFVKSLAILPSVEIEKPPRMTDFAHFGEAIYQASGKQPGDFMQDYKKGREAAVMQSIESSPIASAVIELAQNSEFIGTVGDLLNRLESYRPRGDTGWPKSAKGLSDLLKRYSPAMRIVGVSVEFEARVHGRRQVRVYVPCGGVEGAELNTPTAPNAPKTTENSQLGCSGCSGGDEIPRFSTPPNEDIPVPDSVNQENQQGGFIL